MIVTVIVAATVTVAVAVADRHSSSHNDEDYDSHDGSNSRCGGRFCVTPGLLAFRATLP